MNSDVWVGGIGDIIRSVTDHCRILIYNIRLERLKAVGIVTFGAAPEFHLTAPCAFQYWVVPLCKEILWIKYK